MSLHTQWHGHEYIPRTLGNGEEIQESIHLVLQADGTMTIHRTIPGDYRHDSRGRLVCHREPKHSEIKPSCRIPGYPAAIKRALKKAEIQRDHDLQAYNARPKIEDDLWAHAYLVTEGTYGHSVYAVSTPDGCSSTLQGYGLKPQDREWIEEYKIPYINTKNVRDPYLLPALPMHAEPGKEDAAPWGCLDRCPLAVYAAAIQRLGGTVQNIEPDFEGLKNITHKSKQLEMQNAFFSGNQTKFAELMGENIMEGR